MESAVRAYYDAVDADDYDRLASLLAPEFEHDRPDRVLSGREAFVSFMRDDRPVRDTVHEVSAVYRAAGGDGSADPPGDRDGGSPGAAAGGGAGGNGGGGGGGEWAARGRLIGPDGDPLFAFVDVFAVDGDGRFRRLTTFTR